MKHRHPERSTPSPRGLDNDLTVATFMLFAAAIMLIAAIIAPILAGRLYGWITVIATAAGLAALACSLAAGISLARWRR
jgi:hypothetical protein